MWKAVKSPSSQPIPGAEEPEKSAGVLYRHSAARTPAYGQAASPRAESLPALALFTLSRVLESVHGSPLARSPRPPLTRTPRSLRPHRTHARQTQRRPSPHIRLSGRSASQDGRVLQRPARVHRTRPRRIAHLAHRDARSVSLHSPGAPLWLYNTVMGDTPPCLSSSSPRRRAFDHALLVGAVHVNTRATPSKAGSRLERTAGARRLLASTTLT